MGVGRALAPSASHGCKGAETAALSAGPAAIAPIRTALAGISAPGRAITSRRRLPAPIVTPSPITEGPSMRTSSAISQPAPSRTGPSSLPSSAARSPLR